MGDTPEIRTKTRLVLEKRHQLIDLNKEYVNFEIFFECRSADATKDFEMIVINQEQLNTIDLTNLVMKKTKGGYISGNIIADEDKYQNYFLVIRAVQEDDPHDVDLDITLKPIPPNTEKMNTPPSPPALPIQPQPIPATPIDNKKGCESKTTMYILIAVLAVIVLIILGYILYTRTYCTTAGKEGARELDNQDVFSDTSSSSSDVSKISDTKSKDSGSRGSGILANLIKNKSSKESK
jgi:hypothetical protein